MIWIVTLCAVVFCFVELYQVKRWRDRMNKNVAPAVQAVAAHEGKPARKGKGSGRKKTARKAKGQKKKAPQSKPE